MSPALQSLAPPLRLQPRHSAWRNDAGSATARMFNVAGLVAEVMAADEA